MVVFRPLKSLSLETIYLTKIFCKLLIRNWSPTFNVPLLHTGFAGHQHNLNVFTVSVKMHSYQKLQNDQKASTINSIDLLSHSFYALERNLVSTKKFRDPCHRSCLKFALADGFLCIGASLPKNVPWCPACAKCSLVTSHMWKCAEKKISHG